MQQCLSENIFNTRLPAHSFHNFSYHHSLQLSDQIYQAAWTAGSCSSEEVPTSVDDPQRAIICQTDRVKVSFHIRSSQAPLYSSVPQSQRSAHFGTNAREAAPDAAVALRPAAAAASSSSACMLDFQQHHAPAVTLAAAPAANRLRCQVQVLAFAGEPAAFASVVCGSGHRVATAQPVPAAAAAAVARAAAYS